MVQSDLRKKHSELSAVGKWKMATITESLLRKRAEHNESQIGSLEEISLHQQDIIKIDNIQNRCRDLKILFLQSNAISKIENLWKLKKLQYLNLAINNIERIENLEQCESLIKLDLTLNFIGELTTAKSLKKNYNLRELFLTGNPSWKYKKYREYIIATLSQLEMLDGLSISPSEKITAKQQYAQLELEIEIQQNEYRQARSKEKAGNSSCHQPDHPHHTNQFWKETSKYTPESRLKMLEAARKNSKENVVDLSLMCSNSLKKRETKLFKADGSAMNVNEAKVPFILEDDKNSIILTVDIYKHVDTISLDVDVQPWFVRVVIKSKILQLDLLDEVDPQQSVAIRTSTSRQLIITMPKVKSQTVNKNSTSK